MKPKKTFSKRKSLDQVFSKFRGGELEYKTNYSSVGVKVMFFILLMFHLTCLRIFT